MRHMACAGALPGAYGGLIVEMLMWHAALAATLAAIQFARSPLRSRVPALAFDDHLGLDTAMAVPRTQSLLAGLLCAAAATLCGSLLLQSTDSAQVVLGLMLAFAIGGMVGHMVFPQTNPVGILFSPALVAIAAYAFVLLRFNASQGKLLAGWLDPGLGTWQRVPHLARALPIHYASAAVAGAALGIGWAEGIAHANRRQRPSSPTVGPATAGDGAAAADRRGTRR
jgi:hypothetical protein